VLDCVSLCSQSAAHLYKQFLQDQQIGFVTLGPLRCICSQCLAGRLTLLKRQDSFGFPCGANAINIQDCYVWVCSLIDVENVHHEYKNVKNVG